MKTNENNMIVTENAWYNELSNSNNVIINAYTGCPKKSGYGR